MKNKLFKYNNLFFISPVIYTNELYKSTFNQ